MKQKLTPCNGTQQWAPRPHPPKLVVTLLPNHSRKRCSNRIQNIKNQGSSVRMKKGHESATGGQHNLTTRRCDVQYLGLVGARVWLGLGLVRLSLCLLDAPYDVFAPVSPSSHYISWQWFLPFFLGAPRRKNEVYQTCACGISQHVWQSLFPPEGNSTHRLLPNRLLDKNWENRPWSLKPVGHRQWIHGSDSIPEPLL